MLKVTFTDTGLSLECLRGSLESLLADRVSVHVRTQRAVVVEPSGASIPLPANLPGLQTLQRYSEVSLSPCDRDWVEVSLARGMDCGGSLPSGRGLRRGTQ